MLLGQLHICYIVVYNVLTNRIRALKSTAGEIIGRHNGPND